ncbi:hypothetical protein NXV10_27120 [Bacteroides thetaiotaomicron]|nr:hypothetical protein [Bacteroides thetaiotaomicron]
MKRNLLIITLLFLGSFVILLLGNIIIIGEKIASLSQVAWAEYAFYTLILVVFLCRRYTSGRSGASCSADSGFIY